MDTSKGMDTDTCAVNIDCKENSTHNVQEGHMQQGHTPKNNIARNNCEIFTISHSAKNYACKNSLKLKVNTGECETCLTVLPDVWQAPCCTSAICTTCLDTYICGKVEEGIIDIQCPGIACTKPIDPQTIKQVVPFDRSQRLSFLRVKAGRYKFRKACPFCDYILSVEKPVLDFHDKYESKAVCRQCLKESCSYCMAPWHEGMTCGEYKGSVANTGVEKWANPKGKGNMRNAQMCPTCKVSFINKR